MKPKKKKKSKSILLCTLNRVLDIEGGQTTGEKRTEIGLPIKSNVLWRDTRLYQTLVEGWTVNTVSCLPGGKQRDQKKNNLDVPFFKARLRAQVHFRLTAAWRLAWSVGSRLEVKWLKFESAEEAARGCTFLRHHSVKRGSRKPGPLPHPSPISPHHLQRNHGGGAS